MKSINWEEIKKFESKTNFETLDFQSKAILFKECIQHILKIQGKSIDEVKLLIPESLQEPKSMISNLTNKRFEEIAKIAGLII